MKTKETTIGSESSFRSLLKSKGVLLLCLFLALVAAYYFLYEPVTRLVVMDSEKPITGYHLLKYKKTITKNDDELKDDKDKDYYVLIEYQGKDYKVTLDENQFRDKSLSSLDLYHNKYSGEIFVGGGGTVLVALLKLLGAAVLVVVIIVYCIYTHCKKAKEKSKKSKRK